MNPGTVSAVARTGAVALVIAVAAALGLFVGDALRDGGASGAAVSVPRTASASFSLDAISAIAAIRDSSSSTAAAAEDYPDYPLRHPAAPQQAPKTSPSGATLE
jgi:hypothetical protein